jgi:hypothetical protein
LSCCYKKETTLTILLFSFKRRREQRTQWVQNQKRLRIAKRIRLVAESQREYNACAVKFDRVLNLAFGANLMGIRDFCEKVLRLQELRVVNAIVNPDCKIVPDGGVTGIDEGYTPLDVLNRRTNVKAYVGVTGNEEGDRPGRHTLPI